MTDRALNPPQGHLPFLDGIRGIAILAVFLYHSLNQAYGFSNLPWNGQFRSFDVTPSFLALYPLTYGSAGVAIFFVVSGFCIHLSYRRQRPGEGWRAFFQRRFFRIYPVYLVAVIGFTFIWPRGVFSNGVDSGSLYQFITHVFLVHNLDYATAWRINSSFWSIAVEAQLYLVYPLFIVLTTRFGWRVAIGIAAFLELSIRIASFGFPLVTHGRLPAWIGVSPFCFWFSWAIGAYLAECFLGDRPGYLSRVPFLPLLVIALILPLHRVGDGFAFVAFSLLTAVAIERMIAGSWRLPGGRVSRCLWRHLSFLGTVSYSFYLIHEPLIGIPRRLATRFMPDQEFQPLMIFFVVCACYLPILLLAHASYRFIECRSVALGKWACRKQGAAIAPSLLSG